MALSKTLKGRGNADVTYHMIPGGTLSKDLNSNTYKVDFDLISFVDQDTRDNKPDAGFLAVRTYSKSITEEQMAHIITYLELYDYVKNNPSVQEEDIALSGATDVL